MSDNAKKPALSLASSFQAEQYPHFLQVLLTSHVPETVEDDRFVRDDLNFIGLKGLDSGIPKDPEGLYEYLKADLTRANISDYYIHRVNGLIEIRFKTETDSLIAMASLYPDKPVNADFLPCDPDDSDAEMEEQALFLQEIFEERAVTGITFTHDPARQYMRVKAKTGRDYINFIHQMDLLTRPYLSISDGPE